MGYGIRVVLVMNRKGGSGKSRSAAPSPQRLRPGVKQ